MRIPVPNSFGSRRVREFNTNHEPAGSSKGGQFARSNGSVAPASGQDKLPMTPEFQRRAELGVKRITASTDEALSSGDNTSEVHKIEWEDENGEQHVGVFKPVEGMPTGPIRESMDLGGFFDGARREAAAYEMDRLLGTGMVPETFLAEVTDPLEQQYPKLGSVQEWTDGENGDAFWGPDPSPEDLWHMAVLDYAIGNTDRHAKNWMRTSLDGSISAIDNGLSFPRDGSEMRSRLTEELLRKGSLSDEVRGDDLDPRYRQPSDAFRRALLPRLTAMLQPNGPLDQLVRKYHIPADEAEALRYRVNGLKAAVSAGGDALYKRLDRATHDGLPFDPYMFPAVTQDLKAQKFHPFDGWLPRDGGRGARTNIGNQPIPTGGRTTIAGRNVGPIGGSTQWNKLLGRLRKGSSSSNRVHFTPRSSE